MASATPSTTEQSDTTTPVIGMRRRIAERMAAATQIPHITYVEEVDMTALEHLRDSLTAAHPERSRPTVLPFVMLAIVAAARDHPELNATYDADANTVTTHHAVHIGIATQTGNGLLVPVVHDAHARDLWQTADELIRVTTAARNGTAARAELSGSTISITSLGAIGGLVTTPIINHPEVAIIGINKLQVRPVWNGSTFEPRTMMNLSSSFDHRIIDGWNGATFVQRIKQLLEEPALLFVPAPPPDDSGG
jgi:2-oxoisovalerate dehydrogenase E2 component (dihydrolipoyl transacylase)